MSSPHEPTETPRSFRNADALDTAGTYSQETVEHLRSIESPFQDQESPSSSVQHAADTDAPSERIELPGTAATYDLPPASRGTDTPFPEEEWGTPGSVEMPSAVHAVHGEPQPETSADTGGTTYDRKVDEDASIPDVAQPAPLSYDLGDASYSPRPPLMTSEVEMSDRRRGASKTTLVRLGVVVLIGVLIAVVLVLTTGCSAKAEPAAPSTSPARVEHQVSWIGDEVLGVAVKADPIMGTKDMTNRVYAAPGQTPDQALSLLESKPHPDIVVWAFGTVDDVSQAQLDRLARITGDRGGLVLVSPGSNPKSPRYTKTTELYKSFAAGHKNTRVADWQGYIDKVPSVAKGVTFTSPQAAKSWAAMVDWELNSVAARLAAEQKPAPR